MFSMHFNCFPARETTSALQNLRAKDDFLF
jgi:hypothetical protein